MDVRYFPYDFSTDMLVATDVSDWTNNQVLSALNGIVGLLMGTDGAGFSPVSPRPLWKNYQVVTNEIRRRMQANVENFTLLELYHECQIDNETGLIDYDGYIPSRIRSVSHAGSALEGLADADDDIVFCGVSAEDYMRTWNRMIGRVEKREEYYSYMYSENRDDYDEEHMRI